MYHHLIAEFLGTAFMIIFGVGVLLNPLQLVSWYGLLGWDWAVPQDLP